MSWTKRRRLSSFYEEYKHWNDVKSITLYWTGYGSTELRTVTPAVRNMDLMSHVASTCCWCGRGFSDLQNQGCGVGVPRSPGFGPESESLIWRKLRLRALSVSSGLLCKFVTVYLTFVQFILQLNLCLYTIVQLLLEEFKIFFQVILIHNHCHTISPRVGVPQQNNDSASTEQTKIRYRVRKIASKSDLGSVQVIGNILIKNTKIVFKINI